MWRIKCGLQDKSKENIQEPASLVPVERMMPGAGMEAVEAVSTCGRWHRHSGLFS